MARVVRSQQIAALPAIFACVRRHAGSAVRPQVSRHRNHFKPARKSAKAAPWRVGPFGGQGHIECRQTLDRWGSCGQIRYRYLRSPWRNVGGHGSIGSTVASRIGPCPFFQATQMCSALRWAGTHAFNPVLGQLCCQLHSPLRTGPSHAGSNRRPVEKRPRRGRVFDGRRSAGHGTGQ